MNKRFKNILIGAIVPTLSIPLVLTSVVGCGNQEQEYDKLAQQLEFDAVEEFVGSEMVGTKEEIPGIVSVPRATFHTKQICVYLTERIKKIMGYHTEVHRDEGYEPPEEEKTPEKDWGYNMYFDIPATDPNMPSIILQCHTDMVWKTDGTYTEKHPTPWWDDVDGRPVIKTKNESSTLGADNGIGIGLCLAVAKNRGAFKHGKIRILMTTDEEDGISGAESIPHGEPIDEEKNWFYDFENDQYIPYLLNIDLEDTQKLALSCGGTLDSTWEKEYTLVDNTILEGKQPYELCVRGLEGGYDARGIAAGCENAVKIAYDFLFDFNDLSFIDQSVHIAASTGPTTSEGKIITSDIPTEAHIYFYSNDYSEHAGVIDGLIKEYWDKYHPKEEGFELYVHTWTSTSNKNIPDPTVRKALSCGPKGDSKELMNVVKTLPFEIEQGEDYITSYNVGAVRLNDQQALVPANKAKIQIIGRSSLPEVLGDNPIEQTTPINGFWKEFHALSQAGVKDFSGEDGVWDKNNTSWTPLWQHREDNLLNESLLKGAKSLKLDLVPYDENGWFEVAYFDLHTDSKLHMGALGFDIENAHHLNETLYMDTMSSTIKLMLYGIQNAPNIEIPYEPTITRKGAQYE